MIVMTKLWCRLLVVLALTAPALAGCGAAGPSRNGQLRIVAGFYPLQYVAERVAGSHAAVENLTRSGVEPHDLELTVAQTGAVAGADVVFYERGLAPAVDRTIASTQPAHVVDAAPSAHLLPARPGAGETGLDPHFWQDPTRLSAVAVAFERELARVDPTHKAAYARNLARLRHDLATLDHQIEKGLATCAVRTVVVSHDAFEYYGRRYNLDIQPIAGLSPDAAPSAKHIFELQRLIHTKHVTTVFYETLASPQMAHSLAHDLGIRAEVLDPIEGLSSATANQDYLSLMRANLAALRVANSCSG
jgi:zinc transport system substrate-binding protein